MEKASEKKPLRFEGDEWQFKALGFKRTQNFNIDKPFNKFVYYTKWFNNKRKSGIQISYTYDKFGSKKYTLVQTKCYIVPGNYFEHIVPIAADKVHQLRTLYKLITGKTLSPKPINKKS